MPKVEAKDHRHRQRVTPLSQPRFSSDVAADHTYEFDRHSMSLRISGTGQISGTAYQDFLSSGDARALYGFLRRVYEPPARPIIPLRLERRARQHRQRPTKPEALQADPRPNQEVNETHQEPSLEFGEYNGWVNYPTWSVYTVMTSFDEPREQLEYMASHQPGGRGYVRRAIVGSVENWKNNKPSYYAEATPMLVTDFLQGGVRRVEWTPVYDVLRGEKEALPEDANPLTTLAYELLSKTDWQTIVKDAAYETQADDMLRSWVEDQCLTWIESPDARRHTGSVGQFANKVLDLYFQAVQWDKVTEALRGE